jgi:PAS domain-containing protein
MLLSRRRAERERLATAERALQDLRTRVADLSDRVAEREAVLGAMPDGIVLFSADERVVYANPAARDLFGRRFERAAELSPEALRAGPTGPPRRPSRREDEPSPPVPSPRGWTVPWFSWRGT